jgi:hypothetical protein
METSQRLVSPPGDVAQALAAPPTVTQHTTACCSMQVVDITLAEQASTNITSLRMVQQKHCGPKYKLNFIYYKPKRHDNEVLSVYNNWKASNN